jgi:phenylalanyl-tRNA synthetase beta chain
LNAEVDSVAVFELDLRAVLKIISGSTQSGGNGKFEEFVRMPASHRDLSLIVQTQSTVGEMKEIAQRNRIVSSETETDATKGHGVPAGKKAVAVRLVYQSPSKTLTAEQIAKIEQQILNQLKKELGAELRA